MSIFSRPAPSINSATAPLPELHEGHDDPESSLYVAPELRAAYVRSDQPDPISINERARLLAEETSRAALYEENTRSDINGRPVVDLPTGEAFLDLLDRRTADLMRAEFTALHERAAHLIRLEAAAKLAEQEDHRMRNRTAHEAIHTCPWCGELDPGKNGRVEVRNLYGGGASSPQMHRVRTCWACFDVARTMLREERAADVVADGTTRRKMVALTLQNGAPAAYPGLYAQPSH